MKQTSIEKLSEVYNYLTDGLGEENDIRIANLIKEVIRAESLVKAKGIKFDLFNYVWTGQFREVMKGVFYDDGNQVASDGHILVSVKGEYPADLEGKIVKKDGSLIEGNYPKWRAVIPKVEKMKPYEVDAEKFYRWLEERRVEYKTDHGKSKKFADFWSVKVGEAELKAEFFDKLLTAMKEIGTTIIWVEDSRRAVLAQSDKGVAILMPLTKDDGRTTLVLA